MSSKSSAGHAEVTLLHAVLKRNTRKLCIPDQALEIAKSNPKSGKPRSTSRNAAVCLVKENIDHNT